MTPSELAALDHQHLWHPFTQHALWSKSEPLIIASASGCELVDVRGDTYLDGVSSLWVGVHGHGHHRVDAAIRKQLACVAHSTFLGLSHEPGIRLAAALVERSPSRLTRAFFSNSGSSAVEVALKMAFQAQQQWGNAERTRFASLREAYHGDTLGAVSVGGIDLFHRAIEIFKRPFLDFHGITRVEIDFDCRCLIRRPFGVAERALEVMCRRAQERVAFGGPLADRTTRHGLVTAIGLILGAITLFAVAGLPLGAVALALTLGFVGFLLGAIRPTRDMMVRAATPPGASGRVFGFVMTGLNVGAAVTPVLFGLILDTGRPNLVFVLMGAVLVLSLGTIGMVRRKA